MIRAAPVPPRRDRGFTLIEILVVIVIIAIMAALATLSVGLVGGDRELEGESVRLTNGIALLQEQAQLEGRDYGLRVETDNYEFLRYDAFEQRWVEIDNDPGLLPHQLPSGLAFELELEGRPVLLKEEATPDARLPQLVAWGSGDMMPYRLSLVRDEDARISLEGNPDGTIEVHRNAPE